MGPEPSNGAPNETIKDTNLSVRCVRRDLTPDTTPTAFNFTDQTGVAVSTLTTSNSLTISGINTATAVSITGDGSPQFRINGGAWGTSGNILDGQSLELRLISNAAGSTMNSATVTVGTVSEQWDVTTAAVDLCAGTPSPGDVCADGSVYAGLSPDGNVAMYTTPADAGQFSWNDGTSNWLDIATLTNCAGAAATCDTGEANTALLAALGTSPTPAPYVAARHCDNLTAHGHSDWYLPARNELNVLYTNRAAIGGFNLSGSAPAGWYWSSSENFSNRSWFQSFSGGIQNDGVKYDGLSVRCVRK